MTSDRNGAPPLPVLTGRPEDEADGLLRAPLTRRERWTLPLLALAILVAGGGAVWVWVRVLAGWGRP